MIRLFFLLTLAASCVFAAPVNYMIDFTATTPGVAPTAGSFTCDPAIATFTNFIVAWNSYTFDLSNVSNLGGSIEGTRCGAASPQAVFSFVTGTAQCTPTNVFSWSGLEEGPCAQFSDETADMANAIQTGEASASRPGTSPLTAVIGEFNVSPETAVPESYVVILTLSGGALLALRRGWWRLRMNQQLLLSTVLLAGVVGLRAQGNYFVATTGSDANSCSSSSSPCRTFQGALNRATPNSTVVAMDSGEFGPFTITFPVVVDGGSHGAFVSCGVGNCVNVTPASGSTPVTIRNLSIVAYAGPNLLPLFAIPTGPLTLDHVSVSAVGEVSSLNVGIYVIGVLPVVLKDVTVSGVFNGIQVVSDAPGISGAATFQNVFVDVPGIGLLAQDTGITMRNSALVSTAAGSIGIALQIQHSTSPVSTIESTQIANQGIGLSVSGNNTVRLSNCVIATNTTGVSTASGGAIISFRNNAFSGNGTDGPISLSTSLK